MKINWSSKWTGAYIVGGSFLALSLFFFWWAFRLHVVERSISLWPSVEGTLLSAEIVQEYVSSRGPRLRWVPKVRYSYTVDGKTYEGWRLFWGTENSSDREVVESWLIRTLGHSYETSLPKPKLVYYDSQNPSFALLDNQNYSSSTYGALGAAIFFLFVGLYVAILFIQKARKSPT